jgi:hypothetical protein
VGAILTGNKHHFPKKDYEVGPALRSFERRRAKILSPAEFLEVLKGRI